MDNDIVVDHVYSGDSDITDGVITRRFAEHAYELRMMGVPYNTIARSMGTTEKDIKRAINRLRSSYAKRLERTPGKNIVADTCMFLERVEQTLLYEANLCDADNEYIDSATGQVKTHKNAKGGDKLKYIQAAMDARQKRMDLLMDTGVISKEPQKLQHTLMAPEIEKDETEINRTPEDLKMDLQKLLEQGRVV